MISALKPTLTIRDTSYNAKQFMSNNDDSFWAILKPLLPWIIGFYALDAVITGLFFPDSENGFSGGSLIASYFSAALVISWHRVVIFGADKAIPMNPFKPRKHEIVFILVPIMIVLLGVIIIGILTFITGFIVKSPVLTVVSILLALLALFYFVLRIWFYYPAKATNNSITFSEAFALTKGYIWKLSIAPIRASLKYILLIILVHILAMLIMAGLAYFNVNALVSNLVLFIALLPATAYLIPKATVIGVTVLSNYYLHALQNKS